MDMKLGERLVHGWNAFWGKDDARYYKDFGPGYSIRQDKVMYHYGNERSIVSTLINKIAVDASSVEIKHVRVDENGRYVEEINSDLNYCFNVMANIDQTGRALRQDIYESLLDEGAVAIVPVETNLNPKVTGSYDVQSIRVGRITEWFPENVRIELYNERTGYREEIILPKKIVAIVENPFYKVMNASNSTLKRLNRKIALLDYQDEQSSSGKLDLIIQLPYTIKTDSRRKEAEKRRKDIEMQLTGTKYGIAYTDGTEKITQLNRSIDNNFQNQVEYLTNQLYSELGMTPEILNGTASSEVMSNYYSRIIEPIVSAVCDAMYAVFLTKTAKTQKQAIKFFRDPFKLTPVDKLADIADRFTRNEILSSNEIRAIIGFKPSTDPRADELRNKNIAANNEVPGAYDYMEEDPTLYDETADPYSENVDVQY